MVVAEKPIEYTKQTIDNNTMNRLKVLAGNMPVARYLRQLSVELSKDMPPSFDDLRGGESLTPIKKILDEMNRKLTWLINMVEENRDMIDAIDNTLGELQFNPDAKYSVTMKRNFDQMKRERQQSKEAIKHYDFQRDMKFPMKRKPLEEVENDL